MTITAITDALFIFNQAVTEGDKATLKNIFTTLNNLYIHAFEMILVLPQEKHKNKKQYRAQLYEDPAIHLLCPYQVDIEQVVGVTGKIVERYGINYDSDTHEFFSCTDIEELIASFTGAETLLFVEMP